VRPRYCIGDLRWHQDKGNSMGSDILQRIKLDRADSTPLYNQLERQIRELISSGSLKPGDKLPDSTEFIGSLGISNKTVVNALSILSKEELIVRRRHIGTFVKEPVQGDSVSTIGFFYLHESELFMALVAEHIQRCCARHNYDLKTISFDRDYYDKVDLYEELQKRDLKGAIIVAVDTNACRQSFYKLEAAGYPHVRLGNSMFSGELHAPLVTGDDADRVRQATDYLWQCGHRNIGLVYFENGSEIECEYLKFYAERGGFKERWLMQVNFCGPPEIWQGFPEKDMGAEYLARNPELTAIIFENISPCVATVKQVMQEGKSLPKDLSFVCLADWPGLEMMTPPLTVMKVSGKAMAKKACEILLDIMENGNYEEKKILKLKYQLIERGSVANLTK
jgi:LacI family transcriptional regulator